MMAADLQRLLTRHSGYQFGELDQRFRPLREHNFIPHGPRGHSAPHLEPLHCALGLLSMVSRRAADAAEIMVRAMNLRSVPSGVAERDIDAQLAPFLASGIVTAGAMFSRIDIQCDGALAWAETTISGEPRHILFAGDEEIFERVRRDPEGYDKIGMHYAGHRFTITSQLVALIAAEMDESEAGYAQRKAG